MRQPALEDQALLARVSGELLVVADPGKGAWPPSFVFRGKGTHPFVVLRREGERKRPLICVPPAVMGKLRRYREDALALLLGHALGHITCGHRLPDEAPDVQPRFSDAELVRADRVGAELMVRAGYSLTYARRGLAVLPGWQERLAKLDGQQGRLGYVTPAFRAGVLFLVTERYGLAEICFERVVKEHIGCPEAWVGLGWARLLRYLDRWTPAELREHGAGMVPVPAFRRRGEALRGKDRKLWFDATDALGEGLRQRPDQIGARIALGLAYLFHPDDKDTDRAARLLRQALAGAERRKAAAAVRAEILVDLAAVCFAAEQDREALKLLEEAEKLARQGPPSLAAAILYQQMRHAPPARDRAAREKVVGLFESFLKAGDPLSLWWGLAHEDYLRLCADLGRKPLARELMARRPSGSVRPASGPKVAPGDEVGELAQRIGTWRRLTVLRGMNLARLKLDKHPLELLAADYVLAVCLTTPSAPPLRLGKGAELRVGMTEADLDRLLGRECRPWDLGGTGPEYRFYPEVGLAARLVQGKVTELILVRTGAR